MWASELRAQMQLRAERGMAKEHFLGCHQPPFSGWFYSLQATVKASPASFCLMSLSSPCLGAPFRVCMGKTRESGPMAWVFYWHPLLREWKSGGCCLRWGSPVVQGICVGITPSCLAPSDGYTFLCRVSHRTPPALSCLHLTAETPIRLSQRLSPLWAVSETCLCRLSQKLSSL